MICTGPARMWLYDPARVNVLYQGIYKKLLDGCFSMLIRLDPKKYAYVN